jgi:hypothetical protein
MSAAHFETLPYWPESVVLAQLRACDLLFCAGRYAISRAIRYFSRSRFSHVGLIFPIHGRPVVFENVEDDGVRAVGLDHYLANDENSGAPYRGELYLARVDVPFTAEHYEQVVRRAIDSLIRRYASFELLQILAGIVKEQTDPPLVRVGAERASRVVCRGSRSPLCFEGRPNALRYRPIRKKISQPHGCIMNERVAPIARAEFDSSPWRRTNAHRRFLRRFGAAVSAGTMFAASSAAAEAPEGPGLTGEVAPAVANVPSAEEPKHQEKAEQAKASQKAADEKCLCSPIDTEVYPIGQLSAWSNIAGSDGSTQSSTIVGVIVKANLARYRFTFRSGGIDGDRGSSNIGPALLNPGALPLGLSATMQFKWTENLNVLASLEASAIKLVGDDGRSKANGLALAGTFGLGFEFASSSCSASVKSDADCAMAMPFFVGSARAISSANSAIFDQVSGLGGENAWFGAEAGVALQYGHITLAPSVAFLGGHVEGLSRGVVAPSLSVAGVFGAIGEVSARKAGDGKFPMTHGGRGTFNQTGVFNFR